MTTRISDMPNPDDAEDSEYDPLVDALERKIPKRDRSGHPITDLSATQFSPERQHILRCAELDYVNGIEVLGVDGEKTIHYPSQLELADKYKINTKTLALQATKCFWLKRRKLVQHNQSVYETTLRIKERRQRGDKLQTLLIETLEKLQGLGAYQLWELEAKMNRELVRYAEEQAAGNLDYMPDAGIRSADIEAISRTVSHLSQSRDRIIKEIDRQDQAAIEAMVAEIEAPLPLPVQADEADIKAKAELLAKEIKEQAKIEGVSETDIQAIMAAMADTERVNRENNQRANRTILGQLEGNNEDEDD